MTACSGTQYNIHITIVVVAAVFAFVVVVVVVLVFVIVVVYISNLIFVTRNERHIVFPKMLLQNCRDFCPTNTMYNKDPDKAGTARYN